MVKVILKVSRAGADGAFNAGDEIEVGAEEAQRMVDADQAELARAPKKEKATRKVKAETADG